MIRRATPATPAAPVVHLAPGAWLVTDAHQQVQTVLGSCVAVTMFDRASGLAAICHAMLAEPLRPSPALAHDPARFRYLCVVLPAMIAAFDRHGIDRRAVQVKLFGGSTLLPCAIDSCSTGAPWVGAANVAMAREILHQARFTLSAENTGGNRGRKIVFHTATGEVLHQRLRLP